MTEEKKTPVVFLAGAVDDYSEHWDYFECKEEELRNRGFAVLNPAILPEELGAAKLFDICLAMLRNADAVLFPSWTEEDPNTGDIGFFRAACSKMGKPYYCTVSQICEEVPRCF